MPWPLSQDYNEALQNPQSSFSDPELRQGQVLVNALGIPQPCSGNFADVYAVECPATKTKRAVKCFTREVRGLRERYSEISSYLQKIRLPFTVDFQYLEQGIRIAGRWYPILKMHWVEGFALNAFVRNMLDKPVMLEKLSRIWVRMAHRLREAKLTHCDLQHGNVLLVPDSEGHALAVKLIDYDGMWVPPLAKTPSGEFGHSAYQHPQRLRDRIYNAEVDRFPLLAVHVALRALIAGGRQVWERYDTGDNMLFRKSDFEAPAKSPLFAELLRMNHPGLRDPVVKLIDAARMPLEQTPHLADLVADEKPSKSSGSRNPSPKTSLQPAAQAKETKPKRRRDSLVPWIATGGVAACAVVGGALLWGLQPGGNSEKPSSQAGSAQEKSEEAAPAPGRQDLPAMEDKTVLSSNEAAPKQRFQANNPLLPSDIPKKSLALPKTTKPNNPPRPSKKSKPENPPSKAAPARPSNPEQPSMASKLPVPDAEMRKKATEDIRDIYKAAYASNEPAERAALAEKLLQRGRRQYEPPERRYVCLYQAGSVAAKAGDPILSLLAIEELGKLFAIEQLPMKTAIVQETAKNLHTPSASKALLESSFALLAEAIGADDYEDAERLVKTAEIAAFAIGVPRSALQPSVKKVQRLKTKYAAIKPALSTLAVQPNDPQANRIVGMFRCFEKSDWDHGLPSLLLGDDARLIDLVRKDQAAPTTAEERAVLGDSWWALAAQQKPKEAAKANIQQRACYWYERALPGAMDKARVRIEKRIRQHNRDNPLVCWEYLDISQATMLLGALRLPKGDKAITTLAGYAGPIEITALACTENNNIRLRAGKGACVIFNWEGKRDELRVTRPDGMERPESGSLATAAVTPLLPNTWYLLTWRITEEGMTVSVNENVVFSEQHKNDLSEKHTLSIHSADSAIEVLAFTIRPIGKKSD